jgi:hypothetical protein
MELLAIHAWEKAGKPVRFNMNGALATVLQMLVNYRSIYVIWTDNYTTSYANTAFR